MTTTKARKTKFANEFVRLIWLSRGISGLNHIIMVMGTASSRKMRVRRQVGQSLALNFDIYYLSQTNDIALFTVVTIHPEIKKQKMLKEFFHVPI